MKINISNTKKLSAAILQAEGVRVTARTITPETINRTIKKIEKKLSGILAKKDWSGLKFDCDPNAQSFAASYNGAPESTQFRIQRGANAWFVTEIYRGYTYGPTKEIAAVNIKEKAAAIESFVSASKFWSE